MKHLMSIVAALAATSLFAAPAAKVAYEPVAEGYCAWSGLTDSNYIVGRRFLCPSDLRHKLVSVIFVDSAKWEEQCVKIAKGVSGWNPSGAGESSGETLVLRRDTLCLVVFVGKGAPTAADMGKFNQNHQDDLGNIVWFAYANVTGSLVPDAGGKYPFYCVFGPEPGDPLASGEYDAAAEKKLAGFKKDCNKKYSLNWKPYYGTIEEPQFQKSFRKTLASGKPLDGLTASCRKGVTSKTAEQAKECQILYDALEQTRSDYLFDIQTLAATCPTRALYEAQLLMKQWPKSKKMLKDYLEKINSIPDLQKVMKMYLLVKKVSAEDFQCKNAGEAKKYEAELKKIKVSCDTIVDKGGNAAIMNAAAWIASEAETLAPTMSSKVPVK